MAEDKPAQATFKVSRGTASQAAVSHRPTDSAPAIEDETQPKKHSPHGLSISAEEYERLKSRARYAGGSSRSIAQQDPAIDKIEE
jgi:hypothetical protein